MCSRSTRTWWSCTSIRPLKRTSCLCGDCIIDPYWHAAMQAATEPQRLLPVVQAQALPHGLRHCHHIIIEPSMNNCTTVNFRFDLLFILVIIAECCWGGILAHIAHLYACARGLAATNSENLKHCRVLCRHYSSNCMSTFDNVQVFITRRFYRRSKLPCVYGISFAILTVIEFSSTVNIYRPRCHQHLHYDANNRMRKARSSLMGTPTHHF